MTNKTLITPGQASKILGLTTQTLSRYAKQGKIQYVKLPNNDKRYYKEEILKLAGKEEKTKKKVFYVRSSDGDNKKLQAQVNLLTQKYGEPDKIIKDKASGLNEKRRGLKSLFKLVQKGEISEVCITNKDRLTRFGFTYIEIFFNYCDIDIIVLDPHSDKSLQEELMEDFMRVTAIFSGKYYPLRGYYNQKKLLEKALVRIKKHIK